MSDNLQQILEEGHLPISIPPKSECYLFLAFLSQKLLLTTLSKDFRLSIIPPPSLVHSSKNNGTAKTTFAFVCKAPQRVRRESATGGVARGEKTQAVIPEAL